MTLIQKIKWKVCDKLGHKWVYAFQTVGGSQDIRFCKRCGKSQYWTSVPTKTGKVWMSHVRYTEKGAKEHVEGYGK